MFASTSKTMLGRLAGKQLARSYASTSTATASTVTASSSASPLPAAYRAAAPSAEGASATTGSSSSSLQARTRVEPRRFQGFGAARRPANFYKLHVFATRNNTILTLTTTPGSNNNSTSSNNSDSSPHDPHHAVAWVSGGSAGYKGASRGTYDAAVEVSIKMFRKIKELVEPTIGAGGQRKKVTWAPPTDLEIVWKGFGQGRDAVFRTLMSGEGDSVRGLVKQVTDATPLKVGGTRPKKRRVI